MSPAAILFDEPTSALDPKSTSEVLAVMRDLAGAGQGMIVVTHSIPFARSVAHRVHMLSAGCIIEEGTPQQVLENPCSPVTQQFLKGLVPVPPRPVPALPQSRNDRPTSEKNLLFDSVHCRMAMPSNRLRDPGFCHTQGRSGAESLDTPNHTVTSSFYLSL
jgi:ABC-type glutathione transport system ATPase component